MQQTKNNISSKGWTIGLITGGAAAAAVLAFNKRTRTSIVSGTKQTASTVNYVSSFLSQNREEIITKVKGASNELSHLLQSASGDVQDIVDRAGHLKETAVSAKNHAEQTAQEIKGLNQEDAEQKQIEQAENVEKLPGADERS
ncbi:hypothetical protein [Salibacterium halotolerans]|uniref:Gas vesicle protein n=1 Tax=Salibacterium halotolerans TaxID=1884432 RepID=A0A1I5RH14_9BACI|nr:hypothetical protein [Salibacterium halotolerans]SFP57802.1 hypothetical protein SAMN05518683_10742 [Salibacterium halotolerans]